MPRLRDAISMASRNRSVPPAMGQRSSARCGRTRRCRSEPRRQYLHSPPYDGDGSDDAGSRQGALQDMDLHSFHPVFFRYPARKLCDSTTCRQLRGCRKNRHRSSPAPRRCQDEAGRLIPAKCITPGMAEVLKVIVRPGQLMTRRRWPCAYGERPRSLHVMRESAMRRLSSTVSFAKKILWTCVLDHTIAVAAVRLLLLLTAYRSGDAETLIGRQTSASHLWCR